MSSKHTNRRNKMKSVNPKGKPDDSVREHRFEVLTNKLMELPPDECDEIIAEVLVWTDLYAALLEDGERIFPPELWREYRDARHASPSNKSTSADDSTSAKPEYRLHPLTTALLKLPRDERQDIIETIFAIRDFEKFSGERLIGS